MADKPRRISMNRRLTAEEAERHRRVRATEPDSGTDDEFFAFCEAAAELGATLRSVREHAGLSLADMEERTGMSKSALSRLETGERGNPTWATIERYATALGKKVRLQLMDVD